MKYVNYSVKNKVDTRIPVIALLFLLSVVFCILTVNVFPKGEDAKAQLAEQRQLEKEIEAKSELNSDNLAKIAPAAEAAGKEANYVLDENTITNNVQNLASTNSLSVDKWSTLNDVEAVGDSGNLVSMTAEIEVRGTIAQIEKFLTDLSAQKYISTVKSMSYRMDGQTYLWMYRAIDDDSPITWFEISGDDIDTGDDAEENKTPLTKENLLKHETVTCYMTIAFVGNAG